MSNQTAVAIQAGPQPPALPPVLAKGLATYQWAPGGNRQDAALVEAANAVLPAMEAYLQPAQPKLIEIWCRALRNATARMEDVEFTSRVETVQIVSGNLPAWVWCKAALRDAMADLKFFPTASELDQRLQLRARKALAQARAVREISAATPIPFEAESPLAPPQNRLLGNVVKSVRANYGGADTGGIVGR